MSDDGVDALTGIVAAAANGVGQYVVGVVALFFAFGVSAGLNLASYLRWGCSRRRDADVPVQPQFTFTVGEDVAL
eukprot:COSAG01_NODE_30072_length_623_cov_1.582061_1_plen_75_part_00